MGPFEMSAKTSKATTLTSKSSSFASNWIGSWWKPKHYGKLWGKYELQREDLEEFHLPVFTTHTALSFTIETTKKTESIDSSLRTPPLLPLKPLRTSKPSLEKYEHLSNSLLATDVEKCVVSYHKPCYSTDPFVANVFPESLILEGVNKQDENKGITEANFDIASPSSSCSWYANFLTTFQISTGNLFKKLKLRKAQFEDSSKISREEFLRLFVLKLEEESNYLNSSLSTEEDCCECLKCQESHGQCSEGCFDEFLFENSHETIESQIAIPEDESLEMLIMMSDLANNRRTTSCSIM